MHSASGSPLSIELFPEFGWSIHDEHVYGPGSVFQGIVHLNLTQPLEAERVRLVFRASEGFASSSMGYHVSDSTKEHKLFAIQQVLWQRDRPGQKLGGSSYTFPFTVQMPLIQYPPSMEHEVYHCRFELTAQIDEPKKLHVPLSVTRRILYMPFIETTMLKEPAVKHASRPDMEASVSTCMLDYVPGDTVQLSVDLATTADKKPHASSITAELRQQSTAIIHGVSQKLVKVIATTSVQPKEYMDRHSYTRLELPLAKDVTPSFDYGRLMTVDYLLRVTIKRKGPLGGIWSSTVTVDLPITIGTLGYGIKASPDTQLYTTKVEAGAVPLQCPQFMRAIEYADALPVYDSIRLPAYGTV
ncbi:uncharacterized protein BYT42DRAFT_577335 [Radiomyces spectabilis]|uniref:uncharacterized protein n=1 Tax=Radiomyces spectabilis TaxID=64574 RepID=UPI00221E6571|nr:uncharacterized protein BYT42DRAFT_577335 [Radiomyces spectabilis]KAI8374700.1 hypothetical protein BYT42DRAFT_577335 [Radiomyces spectabilis]